MKRTAVIAVTAFLACAPASAQSLSEAVTQQTTVGGGFSSAKPTKAKTTRGTMLPHPKGCPRRLFCGCGAALEVFGRHRRDLWAARAWFRYPKAAPAAGMVAVRQHHVFYIKQVLSNGLVLAIDHNGGRNKSWLRVRSLAGFSVRNPHA